MKHVFNKIILPCLLAYLALIVFLYLMQNSMVFIPPKLTAEEMTPLKNLQSIEAVTEDNLKIKAYYLKPTGNKPIIVEFHGNGSHPAWEISKFQGLIHLGYGMLLADYRGYDGNPGQANEDGVYKDGDAFLNWVKNNHDLRNNPVVIYGASIGTGIAVETAVRHPELKALILEAPYDRLPAIAAWHYSYIPFVQFLMKNKFYNDEKIKNIKVPVLILLAGKDVVVPMQFGKHLGELANEPKEVRILDDAGHLNLYAYGAEQIVLDFLEKYIHE